MGGVQSEPSVDSDEPVDYEQEYNKDGHPGSSSRRRRRGSKVGDSQLLDPSGERMRAMSASRRASQTKGGSRRGSKEDPHQHRAEAVPEEATRPRERHYFKVAKPDVIQRESSIRRPIGDGERQSSMRRLSQVQPPRAGSFKRASIPPNSNSYANIRMPVMPMANGVNYTNGVYNPTGAFTTPPRQRQSPQSEGTTALTAATVGVAAAQLDSGAPDASAEDTKSMTESQDDASYYYAMLNDLSDVQPAAKGTPAKQADVSPPPQERPSSAPLGDSPAATKPQPRSNSLKPEAAGQAAAAADAAHSGLSPQQLYIQQMQRQQMMMPQGPPGAMFPGGMPPNMMMMAGGMNNMSMGSMSMTGGQRPLKSTQQYNMSRKIRTKIRMMQQGNREPISFRKKPGEVRARRGSGADESDAEYDDEDGEGEGEGDVEEEPIPRQRRTVSFVEDKSKRGEMPA
ncbi:hypothetical protein STCU_09942 [Strigomonas culicis]|uniref:Uncharacterized protein n=1 Tax=Strigomonas culicis TaxID=28005 RepID=S9V6D1_9TRYP|nr:hypothetical protein STCU_09942 [Strigomonas culicis]|eukprot:EPY18475.1 hypothetical protein STCU_09942 [Strigomonas culicis]